MTNKHVLVIIAALAMDLACGMFNNCAGSMKSIDTLATMLIGGVLGNMHASSAKRRVRKHRKEDENAAT